MRLTDDETKIAAPQIDRSARKTHVRLFGQIEFFRTVFEHGDVVRSFAQRHFHWTSGHHFARPPDKPNRIDGEERKTVYRGKIRACVIISNTLVLPEL